jgi:hypothetical protein
MQEPFMLIPSQQLAEGYNQLVNVSDANVSNAFVIFQNDFN